jgi:1,4-dihydroxy-6-naphthoate synthase
MKNTLIAGFSPCPNDTWIFDALVHQRIDTGGIAIDYFLKDVEELNQIALSGEPDIIKVSYAHVPAILDRYVILTSGGALGFNCGPLIVAKTHEVLNHIDQARVAIPGMNTTAHYLLQRFYPAITQKVVMLFSEIEDAVVDGKADAGLIIHESRFTFRMKGLVSLVDLGEMWHSDTGLPLPLGCIAVKRSVGKQLIDKLQKLICESIEYARTHPEASAPFIRNHAASLSAEVTRQHIDLYVNAYSLNLGTQGKLAVRTLLDGKIPPDTELFSDEIA